MAMKFCAYMLACRFYKDFYHGFTTSFYDSSLSRDKCKGQGHYVFLPLFQSGDNAVIYMVELWVPLLGYLLVCFPTVIHQVIIIISNFSIVIVNSSLQIADINSKHFQP